jgi:hypothetical protein
MVMLLWLCLWIGPDLNLILVAEVGFRDTFGWDVVVGVTW